METLILPVIVGLCIPLSIIVLWDIRRKNKITRDNFDPKELTVYLAGRKTIFTQYRGHSVILKPATFVEGEMLSNSPFNWPQHSTYHVPGFRLTLSADNIFSEVVWPDNLPQEEILDHIKQEIFPGFEKYPLKGNLFIEINGETITYQQKNIETDKAYLQFLFSTIAKLIEKYSSIVALGGEAVQPLIHIKEGKEHILAGIAPFLLRDIGYDTKRRFGRNPLTFLCRRCLARFSLQKVQTFKYYGCRACGQSRDTIAWRHPIIIVLDNTAHRETQWNGAVKANWFVRQQMFDFDKVEIVRATDEEIERFVVQMGNDTDPVRHSKYKQMECIVHRDCECTENTYRILRRMFSQVTIK